MLLEYGVIYSQPYYYYSLIKYRSESPTDWYFKIMKYNLKKGTEIVYADKVEFSIKLDPTGKWIMHTPNMEQSVIYNTEDTSKVIKVVDDFYPEALYYSQIHRKLYVLGGNMFDDHIKLSIIDIESGKEIKPVYLPSSACEEETPFFSKDENKFFMMVVDKAKNEYQNKSYVAVFSTVTDKIIEQIYLRDIGLSGAGYHALARGRKGKGIIVSYFSSKPERYYNVYDFEKNQKSVFVNSKVDAEPYFLGEDCQYLALVELKKNKLKGGTIVDLPSGIVKIYDAKTAQLVKTLTYPKECIIKFYDEYPNDIYPLGVKVNGVVAKFSIESLKTTHGNNLKK